MCGQHDAPSRRLRKVTAHPVEGEVVVAVSHRERQSICGITGFDDHPADPERPPTGRDRRRSATSAGRRGRVSPSPGTVRPPIVRSPLVSTSALHPPRQRVEHRRIACPLEAPHAVHGKDGDGPRVGVDHRRDRRPSWRVLHRGHLAAHPPRQIGKRGDQRRAADQTPSRPSRKCCRSATTAAAPASV